MFVRLSLSSPKADRRDDVLKIEDNLLSFFASQAGYIDGYRLTNHEQVGRVTVWESQADAEQAANAQHTLALRSELLMMIQAEPLETALEGVQIKSSKR